MAVRSPLLARWPFCFAADCFANLSLGRLSLNFATCSVVRLWEIWGSFPEKLAAQTTSKLRRGFKQFFGLITDILGANRLIDCNWNGPNPTLLKHVQARSFICPYAVSVCLSVCYSAAIFVTWRRLTTERSSWRRSHWYCWSQRCRSTRNSYHAVL